MAKKKKTAKRLTLEGKQILENTKRLIKPVQIFIMGNKTKAQAQAALKKPNHPAVALTDIILFGGKAGHFNGKVILAAEGEKPNVGADPSAVKVSAARQEMVAWRCQKPFSIVNIEPQDGFKYGKNKVTYEGPYNPFFRELPFRSTGVGKNRNLIVSGPVRPDAVHGRFKITLKIGSKRIDPHIDT
jgi:hypothetical protein